MRVIHMSPRNGATAEGRPSGQQRAWVLAAAAVVAALGYLVAFGRQAAPEQPPVPVIAASGPLLPSGAIRFIAVDGQGSVWFRVANPAGGRDRVTVIGRDGSRRDFKSLRAVVALRTAAVRQAGSLLDFWAVDGSGRVWVGPAFYDEPNWVEVAQDRTYPGGTISYEERVAVDAAGNAWVPYRTTNECPMGGICSSAGLAAFSASGDLVREITFPEVAELAARDLPQLRLVTLADGRLLAVAARAAYALPDATAIELPGFAADPTTGRRDAGFVSAATSRGADAAVFAWRDPTALGAVPVVAELRGYNTVWQSFDLKSCPLLRAGTDSRFVTASAYGAEELLWLASTDGELAARRGDAWTELFTAENSPLGAPVRALAVDDRGALWIGTARGALMYGDGVWHTNMTVHLPTLETAGSAMGVYIVDDLAYVADGADGLLIIRSGHP